MCTMPSLFILGTGDDSIVLVNITTNTQRVFKREYDFNLPCIGATMLHVV